LLKRFSANSLVVATSNNPADIKIELISQLYDTPCYRGDEANVLSRFVEAAKIHKCDYIVRVCADNPMLKVDYIQPLISLAIAKKLDYVSYQFPDGTPAIRSHLGLFTEVVSLDALKKIVSLTDSKLHREHVTNFIYENPDLFKVEMLELPEELKNRNEIRLTIDTQKDFNTMKALCERIGLTASLSEILSEIDGQPKIRENMKEEIARNQK
jgi:spore coat polysaccharide biosynthesis protein SpsF